MAIFGKKKSKLEELSPEEAYLEGKALEEKSEKKAFPYFEYAAENGYAEAQNKLSSCYYHGAGCDADEAKSLYWAEQAAMQGHAAAQNTCASMYEQGIGCAQDTEKALYWYQQCRNTLEAGQTDSKLDLNTIRRAVMRLSPSAEEPKPSPAAKEIVSDTKSEASTQQADPSNGKTPADLFEEAQIMENKDTAAALALYEQAAIMGHPKAQWRCAALFSDEASGCKDENKAFCWFEKLARMGDLEAQITVAGLYLEGIGCKKDEKKTFYWTERAAKQGHAEAQFHCGLMCFQGLGCEKDGSAAYTWFKAAAEQGHSGAEELLAALE